MRCYGLIVSRFYDHVHVLLFQQIIAYDEVITCSKGSHMNVLAYNIVTWESILFGWDGYSLEILSKE